MITESHSPVDTQGQPLTPLNLTRRLLAERMPKFLQSEKLKRKLKETRALDLAKQMNYLGPAALPLPSLAAFNEIQRLEYDEENPFPYVAECIFILSNQNDERKLMLEGAERRRAIYQACKKIHAHNVGFYACCINDTIDGIKKKLLSSKGEMQKDLVNLTSQISSLLSQSSSVNPSATS